MSESKHFHMIFKTIITSQRKPGVYIFTGSESITHAILIFQQRHQHFLG